ncbi:MULTISPECIES: cation:proton antiporter regulatory subunit [Citricoccus]|uniref:cation:proton antiporter regulatory subunit n=1 Tax=Citricoccus TaxID=169133 RepID=UPI000255F5F9|nr:cation:proton antiporter regulatory subunit [Citricoccus sp. CH26A]
MTVYETPLPGIGSRKEIELRDGRRIGIVSHRDGHTELIVSSLEDPDACVASVPLSHEEAASLGALLSAPRLVAQLEDEHAEVPGISTRQMVLASDSPFVGEPLGVTRMRTRTAASIVAVIRAGTTHPSPGPEFLLEEGDVLIIVGTNEGLRRAAEILSL